MDRDYDTLLHHTGAVPNGSMPRALPVGPAPASPVHDGHFVQSVAEAVHRVMGQNQAHQGHPHHGHPHQGHPHHQGGLAQMVSELIANGAAGAPPPHAGHPAHHGGFGVHPGHSAHLGYPAHSAHHHHPSYGHDPMNQHSIRSAARVTNAQKVRHFPIGFTKTNIGAGELAEIEVKPQVRFQGDRLAVGQNCARYFNIIDIKVGKDSQLAATGEMVADAFSSLAVDTRMELDPAPPGIVITLIVRNTDTNPQNFGAVLHGTVEEIDN